MQSNRTKGAAPSVTLGGSRDGSVTLDLYLDLGLLVPPSHMHSCTCKQAFILVQVILSQCRAVFGCLGPDIQTWGLNFGLEMAQSNLHGFR